MKKRYLGLMLLSFVIAGAGYSGPPPAAYKEGVQRQLNNRFNENDIISFVYQADIVGLWQAESKKGEYITFKFRQRYLECFLRVSIPHRCGMSTRKAPKRIITRTGINGGVKKKHRLYFHGI